MQVRFKNFRCFSDTGRINIRPITLLVGGNSSGKTAFLAGINHIFGLMSDNGSDLNTPPFELGSFSDIYCSTTKYKKKEFSYEFSDEALTREWCFGDGGGEPILVHFSQKRDYANYGSSLTISKRARSPNMKLVVETVLDEEEFRQLKDMGFDVTKAPSRGEGYVEIDFGNLPRVWVQEPRDIERFLDLRRIFWLIERQIFENSKKNDKNPLDKGRGKLDETRESKSGVLLRKIRRLVPRQIITKYRCIAIAPLRSEPQRVYSFSQSIPSQSDPVGANVPTKIARAAKSNKPRWKVLSSTLTKFGLESGLFESLEVKSLVGKSLFPFSIMVRMRNGVVSNIADVGYGVSQMLPLIFELISAPKFSLFLIQQPEVHLHPKAQAQFASLMTELSSDSRQFVVETHSDFMLDRLKYEVTQKSIAKEDVSIVFFDNLGDEVVVHQLDVGDDGLPIDPPESYRQFFLEELNKVWP